MPDAAARSLQQRLEELLAAEIRPALRDAGGDIQLVEIDRGVAVVKLSGACGGCAGSTMALVMSLEHRVREQIPEIDYLEVIG